MRRSGAGHRGRVGAHPCAELRAGGGRGSSDVAEPELIASFSDRWHEAWLGSPAVADLDGDGTPEILSARHGLLLGWHMDGEIVYRQELGSGRIWASPVVVDLVPEREGLEVAVAARGGIHAFGADGAALPGFPVTWQDELRTLAAGDIDGDGRFELVVVTTSPLSGGGQRDIVLAVNDDGSIVPGFPPNTTGASGCDDACYVTGGYDQNLALGDVNGDGAADIFATQDNAYLSLHDGTGRAFDAAPIFEDRTKFLGVRFLHDYEEAQMGWAPEESTANQAHFTNSAPAIADLDGDGDHDLVVLGSVQNAAQDDRYRGVALWALHDDGTRLDDFLTPFHAPDYLAGLWDYEGTNVVAATNQVSVADLDPRARGPRARLRRLRRTRPRRRRARERALGHALHRQRPRAHGRRGHRGPLGRRLARDRLRELLARPGPERALHPRRGGQRAPPRPPPRPRRHARADRRRRGRRRHARHRGEPQGRRGIASRWSSSIAWPARAPTASPGRPVAATTAATATSPRPEITLWRS
ncbi:MAG: VCBS repeat-containing protein [Sandaracinaceae bacterium]|nr:VCBS repeat-containing protein [Sandaracinaceae bacterium]